MHPNAFIHWHCHSDGSQFDGLILPKEFEKDLELYQKPCLAITDHGTTRTWIKLFEICKKHGAKFVPGIEAYAVDEKEKKQKKEPRRHVVLLAMNQTGFENLIYLQTLGSMYQYYKPRINHTDIFERSEGLVVLTACLGGIIAGPYLWGDGSKDERTENAERYATMYHEALGENFFLEIQPFQDPKQTELNQFLMTLSDWMDIPIIATNDAHYADINDYKHHGKVMEVQRSYSGVEREYEKPGLHLRNRQEMYDGFAANGTWNLNPDKVNQAIETACTLHERMEGVVIEKDLKIPEYKEEFEV